MKCQGCCDGHPGIFLFLEVIEFQTKHGEVVTLLGITDEGVDGLYHVVNHLFRGGLTVLDDLV